MAELQTKVNIPAPKFTIDYNSNITLLGSCFSDNIGQRLDYFKFNSCANPFGVLYNPASISLAIKNLLNRDSFQEQDLSFFNDLWFSYDHHSSYSRPDKTECLTNINESFRKTKEHVAKTDVLILTLGTSWIYRLKETNQVVANCHKIPAKEFNREFLETDQVINYLSEVLSSILAISPRTYIVFTVSPIRHWKDGAIENMRSKASLIMAIRELQNRYSQCFYFPSFEIYMDELRDYRFYASDMLHPSDFSIELIWERFVETFINDKSKLLLKKVGKLKKSFEHRTFNKETEAYKRFANKLTLDAETIEKQHPTISFEEEKKQLS